MIDLTSFLEFRKHVKSIQSLSDDSQNSQFLSDSHSCAIDFDAVKREYCNAHIGSEDNAKSVDALVLVNGRLTFIEFKNGNISSSQKKNDIKQKVYESLFIFHEISKIPLDTICSNLDFILVYNKLNNVQGHKLQQSPSREAIFSVMSKKSKQSIIRFSMDFLQSRVVSNVFTLNEIEFSSLLKGSMISQGLRVNFKN